ncbi:MAG: twin-arginine translocation signal domain-containing protein, partial [Chloroflexi bacterium]|nr:twin-arginine translocation signal domain-containing protein [Chloroflexota bacterium]
MTTVTRRDFLKLGSASALGAASLVSIASAAGNTPPGNLPPPQPVTMHSAGHGDNMMTGDVDPA